MKRFMVVPFALAALSVNASEQVAAKPDLDKGRQIAAQVCVACHGADGNGSAAANPKLAGQIPEYLYKQMKNFKRQDGKPAERDNAVMGSMVAALSDQDMKSLAAFFASQKLIPDTARDEKSIELGQKLYRGGDATKGLPACAGCHGPAGHGIPAQFPSVGGQWAGYIESQLKAFRSEERTNDPAKMMRMIAVKMTDPEIKAVSNYIAGLR